MEMIDFLNLKTMPFVTAQFVQQWCSVWIHSCYDPGSSLRKRNDLQGKDGSTSALRNLTNGSAWADVKDKVSRARTGGSKG